MSWSASSERRLRLPLQRVQIDQDNRLRLFDLRNCFILELVYILRIRLYDK